MSGEGTRESKNASDSAVELIVAMVGEREGQESVAGCGR